VQGARLLVNGNLPGAAAPPTVTVNAGGVLGGTGTLGTAAATRNVVVNSGGAIAPGTNSPGTLTVTGNVTFNTGSSFTVKLNGATPGTQHDRLVVAGDVTLGNATLAGTVGGGFTPTATTQLFIIDNQGTNPTSGQFNGVIQDGTVTLAGGYQAKVSYTGDVTSGSLTAGNDVVLYNFLPVPEPATFLGIAAVSLAAGYVRRRLRPATL